MKKKMATKRKSIVDEALIEADQISEAFETNAKEILTHAMGSEIEQMVKESLEDLDGDLDDDNEEEEATDLDDMSGMGDLEMGDDDGEELDLDLGDEDDMDLDLDGDDDGEELDLDLDGDDLDLDDEGDDEMDLDGEVDMIDLTGAEDSEVISVFKKMGPEDEIQVVRDGNNLDITDTKTNAEYRIDLGGGSVETEYEGDVDDMGDMEDIDLDDMGDDEDMEYVEDDDSMEESVIYEIELDEEDHEEDMDDMNEMDELGEDDMNEMDELEEDARQQSSLLRKSRKQGNKKNSKYVVGESRNRQPKIMGNTPRMSKLLKENTVLKNNIKSNKSENEELRENQKEMVGALKVLRQKLQEVAVFNSNLTYSVRLMTENATTKEEKVDIIKGMDEAKSLKESKSIYRNLVKVMTKTKTPIKESIDEKINKTKTSGAQIVESKVYINEELAQQKKLWEFNYKY